MITIFRSHTGDQVMVDTNAEIAFGPVFGSDEDPQDFLDWLLEMDRKHISLLTDEYISSLLEVWRKETKEVVV